MLGATEDLEGQPGSLWDTVRARLAGTGEPGTRGAPGVGEWPPA